MAQKPKYKRVEYKTKIAARPKARPKKDTRGPGKLTESLVKEIRAAYKPRDPKFGKVALAKKYKVSAMTLFNVLNRKTWKDVA